jgi:hypothetical protein
MGEAGSDSGVVLDPGRTGRGRGLRKSRDHMVLVRSSPVSIVIITTRAHRF